MADNSSRHYPVRPVLAVGALIFRDECILLIERGKEPLRGEWTLPGGAVETGERLEDAITREVWEETGLRVSPRSVALIFERIMRDERGTAEYHYVIVDYICEIESGTVCAGDDCSNARWVRLDALDAFKMTAGTLEAINQVCQHGPQLTVLRP